jgi:undecaprenyl-diphosphatase
MAGVLIALTCARLLSITMPFSVRPFANPAINFKIPLSFSGEVAEWSSFPSNHAALFASLATGLYVFSPRMLLFVVPYLVLVIFLPRIFMGFLL